MKIFTFTSVEDMYSNKNSWSTELDSIWIQQDNISTQLDKIQFLKYP